MIKQLKYILILAFVMSCNSNTIEVPKKPSNLIGKDKMADIIYDMSVFTAAKGVGKWNLENKGIMPEAFIYDKYNIDSLQFALSNTYYSYHIEDFEAIYDKVNGILEEEKAVFDSIIQTEELERADLTMEKRKTRDSIDRIKAKNNRQRNPNPKLNRLTPNPSKKVDSSGQLIRQ